MSSASCTVLTGTYGDLGRRSTGYYALDGLMLVYEREWPYHTTSRSLWRCIDAVGGKSPYTSGPRRLRSNKVAPSCGSRQGYEHRITVQKAWRALCCLCLHDSHGSSRPGHFQIMVVHMACVGCLSWPSQRRLRVDQRGAQRSMSVSRTRHLRTDHPA